MEPTKYIHYGHTGFDPNAFNQIQNEPMFAKPIGGLWASPIDSPWGWKDWCDAEQFRECTEENSFTFTLSDDAKILRIYDIDDLKDLPEVEGPSKFRFCTMYSIKRYYLDFEKLSEEYDGIEVFIETEEGRNGSLYWALYGWDCNSVCIFNPDIIVLEEK